MKIVAETFPWTSESMFAHTADNHTSVLGMREVATHAGASSTLLQPSLTMGKHCCPPLLISKVDNPPPPPHTHQPKH